MMKKVLFVHDNRLVRDNKGNVYSGSCYNASIWERYLAFCDELTICMKMRVDTVDVCEAKKRYNIISDSRIRVAGVNDVTTHGISEKIKSFRQMIYTIKEAVRETDYLIARMPSATMEGNIAIHYAKKYKKPYMVEVVACVRDSLWNHSSKGKLLAYPCYWVARHSIKNAPYAVYVTREYLQKRYPCKGKIFSVSDAQIELIDESEVVKKYSERDFDSKLVIGSAGAVDVKYKGHETVIRALQLLQKDLPQVEYQIAGDGDQSRLISIAKECGVEERVKFIGSVPHQEINTWLDGLDIYIQPSKNEGLPRALIEAMSRGLCCFGTDTGGIPELLGKEYLFRKGDGCIQDVGRLLMNVSQKTILEDGLANREKAKEFTEAFLSEKRKIIYGEVLNELH